MNDRGNLAERITERRAGTGDPRVLTGELRRARLLVPLDGGGLWTAHFGGTRWICAFTDENSLARFVSRHGPGGREWEYAVLLGARLLDEIVPAMGEPAGVAVDVADEEGAMFFPPVVGIVPEAVAVDAEAEGPEAGAGPGRSARAVTGDPSAGGGAY
ncbi:hypothetical protein [Streptomyces sp. YIM S03343]